MIPGQQFIARETMMTKVKIIMRCWEDTDHVEMDTSGQDKDLIPDLCYFFRSTIDNFFRSIFDDFFLDQ